jgi:hypothetical protein
MKKLAEEGKDKSLNGGTENGDEKDETGPEQLSAGGDVTSFTTSELPVPKSMANRNKKKGFMKEMLNAQGTKIVYGTDAQASSTPVADVPIIVDDSTVLTPQPTGTSTTQRRVLPPSEMDLPSNVFVTHQVYDRRGWTPRGRAARHRAEAAAVEEDEEEEMEMEMDVEEEVVEEPKQSIPVVPVDLPNGAVDLFSPAKGFMDDDNMWTKAEERFDELPLIDLQSLPAKESIIVWKVCQPFLA